MDKFASRFLYIFSAQIKVYQFHQKFYIIGLEFFIADFQFVNLFYVFCKNSSAFELLLFIVANKSAFSCGHLKYTYM